MAESADLGQEDLDYVSESEVSDTNSMTSMPSPCEKSFEEATPCPQSQSSVVNLEIPSQSKSLAFIENLEIQPGLCFSEESVEPFTFPM